MKAWLKKYVQGTNGARPVAVGLVRGLVETAALAGIVFLAFESDTIASLIPDIDVAGIDLDTLIKGLVVSPAFWRTIEGKADDLIDPAQNRAELPRTNGTGAY